MKRNLESLWINLENGWRVDKMEKAYAASMGVRLFINEFHCDEKLVLRAIAKNLELSPEEALASLKKEVAAKKAKDGLA